MSYLFVMFCKHERRKSFINGWLNFCLLYGLALTNLRTQQVKEIMRKMIEQKVFILQEIQLFLDECMNLMISCVGYVCKFQEHIKYLHQQHFRKSLNIKEHFDKVYKILYIIIYGA